jgi:hypothetical protein
MRPNTHTLRKNPGAKSKAIAHNPTCAIVTIQGFGPRN